MEQHGTRTSFRLAALVAILLTLPGYFWGVASSYEKSYSDARDRLPDLERRLEMAARLSTTYARMRFQMDKLRATNPGNRSLQSRLESLLKEADLGADCLPTMTTLAAKVVPKVGTKERVRLILRNMTLRRIVRGLEAIEADDQGMRIEKVSLAAFGNALVDRLSTLTLEVSTLTLE